MPEAIPRRQEPLVSQHTMLARVVSGEGRAAGFTSLEWVGKQCTTQLGFNPFPGTLNLRAEEPEALAALSRVRAGVGLELSPRPGFCAARCFLASVSGYAPAALIVPEVAGYPTDLLELLAPLRLRDHLGLQDGDLVEVRIWTAPG